MKSYLQILKELEARTGHKLITVFHKCGISDSTYYRSRNGAELSHKTALKVWRMYQMLQGSKAQPHEKQKLKDHV